MSITAPCENKEAVEYKPFSNAEKSQTTSTLFNNKHDSCSINSHELVGGKDQVWKIVLERVSQKHFEHLNPQNGGEKKVKNKYKQLKNNFSVFDCPITLDSENATFDDIAMHALFRQRLSPGTVERNIRYMRFMEKHEVPINFRNPTFENFIHHADYREQIEGKG